MNKNNDPPAVDSLTKAAGSASQRTESECEGSAGDRGAGRQKSAILGVSIGNEHYYTRERLRSYLVWGRDQIQAGRFSGFAFLIGDSIHKYDYVVFHDVSLEHAEAQCLAIGERLQRAINRSMRATKVAAEVLRWKDIEEQEQYDDVLRAVEHAYEADRIFRAEIESQVNQYVRHVERYSRTHVDQEQLKRSGRITCLQKYLVYEIAGLIVLAEYTDYAILVYPGEDLLMFADIYRGKFPGIRACLPKNPRREFIDKSF